MGAKARRGAGGFTFVELLVATIMVGLLAALMIPVFLGLTARAHEATAQSLLRSAASAVEAAAAEDGYGPLTPAALEAMEPNVAWLDLPGATAADEEVSVTDLGPFGYRLTSTGRDGITYVYEKDLLAQPTVSRTCGAGCTW